MLAAGAWRPTAIADGFQRVQALQAEMAIGRRRRLLKRGFPEPDAARRADLHTRSFM